MSAPLSPTERIAGECAGALSGERTAEGGISEASQSARTVESYGLTVREKPPGLVLTVRKAKTFRALPEGKCEAARRPRKSHIACRLGCSHRASTGGG